MSKTSELYELTAEKRSDLGKGASRRLRRLEDKVPAIIYGGGEEPVTLSLEHNKVLKALENEAFYNHILTLHIGGKKQKAVLKDLQRHPFKPRIMHMDFLRITGKDKITMHVPLHFINDNIAPGVTQNGGLVSHLLSEVEIRCLPADLPEYIEVDLANLQLDESIHLSNLKLPKGVELVALAHDNDLPVANIHIPRAAVEEVSPEATEEAASGSTAEPTPEDGNSTES
jgi:large subunit ribosomal protein L25